MDYNLLVKAGFMGFASCMGAICLVFFVSGNLLKIDRKKFGRVYLLASVVSFLTVYILLHVKITSLPTVSRQIFLTGAIGGWLSGVLFGATQFKRFLISMLRLKTS
ncbi:MAG: hypothetical protein ACP5U1_00225 [Desulfomonilaceae bacterium]